MNVDCTFKKIVFFDFTGTLFDPFVNIKRILNSIAKEKGFKYYNRSELKTIKKMPPIKLLNTFLVPDHKKKIIVEEVLNRLENEIQQIPPIAGIENMLHTLKEQNCYLGILSGNKQDNLSKWLLANNLDIFHEKICIPYQEAKTPYLKAVKNKFHYANDFYFMSDEARDLVQAREAGFFPIGVIWGFDNLASLQQVNPTMILSNPKEFVTV